MQPGYKPSWIKISLLSLALIAVVGGIFFLIKIYPDRKGQDSASEQDYAFEALVQAVDQTSDDPVIDRRLNLKKGDVLAVFPKGHEWAGTERQNYLILKLNIGPEEAAKLVEAEIGEVATGEENSPAVEGLVRMRAYRIKTESLKFNNADELQKGQPYENKVFDEKIIEKKGE